ncbi:MAG TPA: PspC domain-containing protein [Candidatus Limnocylindrales bacterium]
MSEHLHRSRTDRMLAGVAGGLAEMWDADPSLLRLVWALLVVFTGGIALVVYIVMAIVVPEEDEDEYLRPMPPFTPAGSSTAAASDAAAPTGVAQPAPGPNAASAAAPGFESVPVTAPPTYWMPGSGPSRADARAARRAARRQRGDGVAPAVIGVFLVLLGGFFLAREWLPDLDWNWFWPTMLIALGVLLLVLAMGRRDDRGGQP